MNRFYILLFALFTLALVGCEKEEFVFDEPMIEGSDDATTDGEDDGEEPEPAPEPVTPGEGDTNPEPTDPNDGQGNKKSKIIKRIAKPSPIKYPRPLAVPMD
ncbi:MAG: hypothetical protein IKJ20_03875 [Alistipes sp.]|nr:hypothetical protein [Alistipes sp.]MBR3892585.1 hypothetical protein [Alistipes sp.]